MKRGGLFQPVFVAVVWCVVLGLSSAHAAPGDILSLGTLGGSSSYGHSINAAGQVAGQSVLPDDFTVRAYRFTDTPGSGTMVDLGTLGGQHSVASAVNASGQVAGQSEVAGSNTTHAFLYTGTPDVDGVMHDLGSLVDGIRAVGNSHGFAINNSGQVAGMSTAPHGDFHAFRYTGTPGVDGVMEDLGTLGGAFSQAYAINASGQVAGLSGTVGNATTRAFLYTGAPGSPGVMTDLGTLGGTGSGGYAINAKGHVVGDSALAGDVIVHAFHYTGTASSGVMTDLGTLGGSYSRAWGLNSFDQVVGESYTAGDAARRAFLYTGTPGTDGVMIDLNAWLDAVNPIEGAKWSLAEATGITDAGLITGNGYYDDGPGGMSDGFRAYLLEASSFAVPEPSTLSVVMFFMLSVAIAFMTRCALMKSNCSPRRSILSPMLRKCMAVLSLIGALSVASPMQAAQYIVNDLGQLGAGSTVPLDINDAGQVVGESGVGPFLYDDGVMYGLATLGWSGGRAHGINASGQVTGWSYLAGDSAPHAFLWTPSTPNGNVGTMLDLGTLGGSTSRAYGINDAGHVVGESYTDRGAVHGFLYDGTMRDVGNQTSYMTEAAINASGQIAGSAYDGGKWLGTIIDETSIEVLDFSGVHVFLSGINDRGQSIGYRTPEYGDPFVQSFVYENGTTYDVPSLGGNETYANGLNNFGEVVGSGLTADGLRHAFLYSHGAGTMVDLNILIDPQQLSSGPNGVDELIWANAINDRGQIVAAGWNGYLLTPVPEPATYLLCGVAACLGFVMRVVTHVRSLR